MFSKTKKLTSTKGRELPVLPPNLTYKFTL